MWIRNTRPDVKFRDSKTLIFDAEDRFGGRGVAALDTRRRSCTAAQAGSGGYAPSVFARAPAQARRERLQRIEPEDLRDAADARDVLARELCSRRDIAEQIDPAQPRARLAPERARRVGADRHVHVRR